jgi:DnaJ-domain-containing protein 1
MGIFKRLEQAFSNTIENLVEDFSGNREGSYVDPDIAQAEEELEAFLRGDPGEMNRFERTQAKTADYGRQRRHNVPKSLIADFNALGLDAGASFDDCKKAYRILCKKYHPDRDPGGAVKFMQMRAAYERIIKWQKQA